MKASYHHGELADALIAAALAMLETGEELSLRSVARAAGVSAMAPYRHFADKAALMDAVAARGFEQLRTALVAVDQGRPAAALLAQGRAYINFARAHPALFRLMFAGTAGTPSDSADTAYGVLAHRVASLTPGRGAPAVLASWAMVHGLATLLLDGRLGASGETAADAALALFVDGLAGPERT
jgi:AcrR family transcriptional regulator